MRLKTFVYNFCLSFIFLALWQNGSCRTQKSTAVTKEQDRVATGIWGGQNVRMEVTDVGAQLTFSCSHGTIDEPLVLDSKGHFSATGSITADGPGPIREDPPPKKQTAIYSGEVEDKIMKLTVKLTKTDEQAGNFTLELGKPGRVRRCY